MWIRGVTGRRHISGPELMKLGRSRRKEGRMSSLDRGPPLTCRDFTRASSPCCMRTEISCTMRLSSGQKCLQPTHHTEAHRCKCTEVLGPVLSQALLSQLTSNGKASTGAQHAQHCSCQFKLGMQRHQLLGMGSHFCLAVQTKHHERRL